MHKHEDAGYCSYCGGKILPNGRGGMACGSCDRPFYLDPKLAAACIVSRSDSILLVRRGIEPQFGRWSFPSGYVNRGEDVAEAAAREVREETHVTVRVNWLVGLYSQPDRPVVLAVYDATQIAGEIGAGDETLDARMFPVGDLPELAFTHDRKILTDWRAERDRRGLVAM